MAIIKTLLSNLFSRPQKNPVKPKATTKTVELKTQPDGPEDFGFKMNWFAIKTFDGDAVLKALNVGTGNAANWSSGVQAAYSSCAGGFDKDLAFVTPPVDGWIMVAGTSLPYPVMHTSDRHDGIGYAFDVLLSRLGTSFSDVQFFGSYRGVGFVAWARRQTGKPDRIFAFGDGDVYANIGKQTSDEVGLGLQNLDDLSLAEATARMFENEAPLPDEDVPLLLAERWSVNPGKLTGMSLPPACGVVVELPDIASY